MRRSSHQPCISSTRVRYASATRNFTKRKVSSEKRWFSNGCFRARFAPRYGRTCRSRTSRRIASDFGSVGGGGGLAGFAGAAAGFGLAGAGGATAAGGGAADSGGVVITGGGVGS